MKTKQNIKAKDLAELFQSFAALEAFARRGGLGLDAIVVLLWLQKEQRSTVGRLSSSLSLSSPKTTRCLKELRNSGLVDESLDSDDLRKCHFKISGKGVNVAYEVVWAFREETIARLIECFASLRRAARTAEQTSGYRITSTAQRILLSLYTAKSPLTVNQLCTATSLPQPKVSMSLKALRACGLVEVEAPESDRRTRSTCLSKAGLDLVATTLLGSIL